MSGAERVCSWCGSRSENMYLVRRAGEIGIVPYDCYFVCASCLDHARTWARIQRPAIRRMMRAQQARERRLLIANDA